MLLIKTKSVKYVVLILRLQDQLYRRWNLFYFHRFSVETIKDGERYQGFVGHGDPGATTGRKPGSSFLSIVLHLCCPGCGAVWQIR